MAFLSWLITLLTLLIFITAVLPEEKRIVLENFETKARNVAVALQNTASVMVQRGAFNSVTNRLEDMLKADRSITYLVITRNDGFSVMGRQGQPAFSSNALAPGPSAAGERLGGISRTPYSDRRVYGYSLPFVCAGSQWGWIHVGLSLNSYERDIDIVYYRTCLLAVLCVGISLAASLGYARQLVRPILHLRNVVRKVAEGDLSARAPVDGTDELGILCASVNTMTEALLKRDNILQSIRYAAQQLLSTPDWHQAVPAVLAKIGEAAQISHIGVFQCQMDQSLGLIGELRYQSVAPGVRAADDKQYIEPSLGDFAIFAHWAELLRQGQVVGGHTREWSGNSRDGLEQHGFKSLLIIPIMVEGALWGVLTLAECRAERRWTPAEDESFRAAANMLGAAIARQRARDAVVEANETLEQRVGERTKALQEQVAATRRAHAELAETQQRLIDTSHQAGMAEVATGVLHNVGNVLNSVNVSTTLIREKLRHSEIASLAKLAGLLKDHDADLAAFLTTDTRGKIVPGFIVQLAQHLDREHGAFCQEIEQLARNVEHIKEIVAMQQNYARVSGVVETVSVATLLDDAIQMNLAGLKRHQIEVVRQYTPVPGVTVEKHKVLQLLVNLVQNAQYAINELGASDRRITAAISINGDHKIKVSVADNGIGIPPENLTKIFAHGFTTRKDGHGFGLHSGANAAREMGGLLRAHSDGLGKGAVFTLELPAAGERTTS